LTVLQKLARRAIRYGLKPEEIGPTSTFTDDEYMTNYLGSMDSWESPSFYGCTAKHRDRARREWRKLVTKVRANTRQAGSRRRVTASPTARPLESEGQAIHAKSEDERDDSNS